MLMFFDNLGSVRVANLGNVGSPVVDEFCLAGKPFLLAKRMSY